MTQHPATKSIRLVLAALFVASCVEHRPIRNGLRDESIYLVKEDLTRPNPKLGEGSTDDGWLYKVTVVKASSPNVVGDYAFPGFESDLRYVKFRFNEEVMQLVDGRTLQRDLPEDPNDDLATRTDRVVMEFAGTHVDVKLRESLDGERTNFLEENTEEPWQKRQKFKVDLESTSLDPITSMAWFYGQFLHDCATPVSTHLVPGSFEWDPADQYMSWVIEANYQLTIEGGCYDLVSLAQGVGTATIQYRLSFYRPGPSDYVPEEIAEKAPVNKKYGAFQVMNLFRDSETGILSAKNLLQRWNPDREEPVVFYFHEGFPEKFKPMFEEIMTQTNQVLEQAGAKLRIDFRDFDDGGIRRNLGDIRYSFVVWHQDIDTTRGLLGYGPSSADPRTGEVLSANLNLYNVGLDYYRFLIQSYLEDNGGLAKPDPLKKWEEIACQEGATTAPTDVSARFSSGLFSEMRRVMGITAETGAADDFLPSPVRSKDAFLADYHRMLGEYRYVEPLWNAYVYQPTAQSPLAGFRQRLATEREFQKSMDSILRNQNPFGPVALYTREGIQKQLEFREQFNAWRKNHERLQVDQEMLLGLENIYVFELNDAITAISRGARRCVNGRWESDDQYRERIIEDVVFHVAIHELGHNLGLRHNFYGSIDAKHMRPNELSASVMDYVASQEEAGTHRGWGQYDEAALTWIYGTPEKRAEVMQADFLYCTDEHRFRSPLCTAHDLGVTPSQIVLNAIERYDHLYEIRNRRAYRTFWDTSGYVYSIYNSVFQPLRMWYLAQFDWGGGGVQDTLKRLDQINGQVKTDQEYDEIAADFYNEISTASNLVTAFYDAVINQPASLRNYQTEFDPYYGDILRLGIILDKLFTTFAFMDLQDVSNYDPNVQTYIAMYDSPFDYRDMAISQRVLDNMLGANYDTFPWFRYFALNIYAAVTNTNLVYSANLKDRIAIRRYDNQRDLEEEFGTAALAEAMQADNPSQLFVKDGETYVYTYLPDRHWHLVASKSRNPVSYQYMREYNEDLNAGADPDLDNYGLKVLLAYYEYFNNFSGY